MKVIQGLYLLLAVFLILGLVFNLNSKLPKLPGDIFIDRGGFKIYIPFLSAIIVSAILTIAFNFFQK